MVSYKMYAIYCMHIIIGSGFEPIFRSWTVFATVLK